MAEIEEEQSQEGLDLGRYINVARRRHLHFLIPAFLGWLIVWGATWFLEVRYKSGTLILVEQPTMPKNYVTPNVNDDLQDRLRSITQQILSRTRLMVIIDKLHLYEGKGRKYSADEKVEMMRKNIDLELVHDARGDQVTSFRISFWAHDPHVAQAVANELTDLFINENLKVRQEQSQQTTGFIEDQLKAAAANLAQQEAKVQQFKVTHQGELPEQQVSNLQILGGLQQQLQNESGALNTAKQQREFYQTEINQYRALHGTTRAANGQPTGLAAMDAQLDQLRTKLAELSSHYTDQYPDVVAVKDQIARTEKSRAALAATLKDQANAKADDSQVSDDPTTSATLLQLQGQLHANLLEITNREQAVAELKGRIGEYQGRLNGEPVMEQQMLELTRGYEQSKLDYADLMKKRNESEMATRAEELQQGERFTRLDPATLPQKPDYPNRLKFCGLGLGVGLALGLVVVLAFEFFDDRMHSEKDIRSLLPVMIIGEIPEVLSVADVQTAKRKIVLGWAMTAAAVVVVMAGAAFSFLRS